MTTNALWNVWNDYPTTKIKGTCFTLKGFSIAALRTNFYIPELKIMFDAGISGNIEADYILITHCHSDHTASIPFHTLLGKDTRVQIYAPPASINNIDTWIKQMYVMSCNVGSYTDLTGKKTYDMIEANEGEYKVNNRNMLIEVINCFHSVPSVGYGLIEVRQKLKEEYKTLAGADIKKLIKEGISVTEPTQLPFFLYLGDTDHRVLDNANIYKYRTIMIECTFIVDSDLEQAHATNHMHWTYLKPHILKNPDITFILYHFSQRYKRIEIDTFFQKEASDIPNIIIWNNNA